jgi:hypothetical protein
MVLLCNSILWGNGANSILLKEIYMSRDDKKHRISIVKAEGYIVLSDSYKQDIIDCPAGSTDNTRTDDIWGSLRDTGRLIFRFKDEIEECWEYVGCLGLVGVRHYIENNYRRGG